MSYTALAVTGVIVALVVDRWVARTRLTSSRTWWSSFAIIIFFQILTNGWLTGRRIVQYRPDAIIGDSRVELLGAGRLGYAPVEDVAFGFALVLLSSVAWDWLGRRRRDVSRTGSS